MKKLVTTPPVDIALRTMDDDRRHRCRKEIGHRRFRPRSGDWLVPKNLETIVFDPSKFEKELKAFGALLKSNPELSEREDLQPFF